jgi:membrane associated rhomboid family serine protease
MRPPQDWRRARVTLAIAAVTAVAFLLAYASGLNMRAASWGGFMPYRFSFDGYAPGAPVWLTPLTATLIHRDFIHIAFNLLILLFCGRPVENVLGPVATALLYLIGAYAAALGHYALGPLSTAPMIGASGAISAVLGAYAMLFGRNKVKVANPTVALWLNALWLMAAWVVLQLCIGIALAGSAFLFGGEGVQVAVAAHIGGFLVGLLLANPLLLFRYRKA